MTESNSFGVGAVAAVIAVVAIGAGAWYFTMSPAPGAGTGPAAVPAGPAAPSAAPATAVPTPAPTPTPAANPVGTLRYAGGQTAPALNGVTQDVQLDWEGPWSPIARTVTEQGWQWYVHQDGSYSTTRMIDMNGVPQAMALRAQPTQPLPALDDAALRRMMPRAQGR